jgi:hypothetical protein
MAKKLTLIGPCHDGNFHVHKAGCRDIDRDNRNNSGNPLWHVEATTRKDVVTSIYDPHCFEYDADTDWDRFDDLKVYPCVGDLPSE